MDTFKARLDGASAPCLPDSRVVANGAQAVIRSVTTFDSPFASDRKAVLAVACCTEYISDDLGD